MKAKGNQLISNKIIKSMSADSRFRDWLSRQVRVIQRGSSKPCLPMPQFRIGGEGVCCIVEDRAVKHYETDKERRVWNVSDWLRVRVYIPQVIARLKAAFNLIKTGCVVYEVYPKSTCDFSQFVKFTRLGYKMAKSGYSRQSALQQIELFKKGLTAKKAKEMERYAKRYGNKKWMGVVKA